MDHKQFDAFFHEHKIKLYILQVTSKTLLTRPKSTILKNSPWNSLNLFLLYISKALYSTFLVLFYLYISSSSRFSIAFSSSHIGSLKIKVLAKKLLQVAVHAFTSLCGGHSSRKVFPSINFCLLFTYFI